MCIRDRFPVVQISSQLNELLSQQGLHLPLNQKQLSVKLKVAVWTTTPWTLPANAAVAINENVEYAFARSQNNQLIILAADLLEEVSEEIGSSYEKVAVIKGRLLDGALYKHPLFDKVCPFVIGGSYITTQSGTGIVHTCLLYTSPSPRDGLLSRMPSSA